MQLVLLRHCSRIDKRNTKVSDIDGSLTPPLSDQDTSNWLATFDPPLDIEEATAEMDLAFKRMAHHIPFDDPKKKIIIHSSPYNRCIQTTELFLKHLKQSNKNITKQCKLRIDQSLSEWLNDSFNLNYLPPSDDGYSIISNLNNYLNWDSFSLDNTDPDSNSTKELLKTLKDPTWIYNKFGHCGDYGESLNDFKKRTFTFLINILQFYYQRQSIEDDKNTVLVIISHGATISTLLQILLNRPLFKEIPLCSPVYLKQSADKRSLFKLMDYDFNLTSLLDLQEKELLKLLNYEIDVSLLDFDTLYKEYEPSVIPSQFIKSKPNRNRSNTLETPHNNDNSQLKQTRSSRQLHLLNTETNESKVIDLDKLNSYFSAGSDSEDSDESEDEDDRIVFTPASSTSQAGKTVRTIEPIPAQPPVVENKPLEHPVMNNLSPTSLSIFPSSPPKKVPSSQLLDKLVNAKNSIISKSTHNKIIEKFTKKQSYQGSPISPEQSDSEFDEDGEKDLVLSFNKHNINSSQSMTKSSSNSLFKSDSMANLPVNGADGKSDVKANDYNLNNSLADKKNSSGLLNGTFSSTFFNSNMHSDGNSTNSNKLDEASHSLLNSLGFKAPKLKLISNLTNTNKSREDVIKSPTDSWGFSNPLIDFKRRRKNSDLISVHSNGSNTSSKSIVSSNINSLKHILFQNNSSAVSEDDGNWFGGGFQKQKV